MEAQEGESMYDYDADLVGNITLFFLESRAIPINDSWFWKLTPTKLFWLDKWWSQMHPTNESRPLRMPHIGNTPAECAVDLVWVGFFRCYEELQTTFCK